MTRSTDNQGSVTLCQGIRDRVTQVCPGAEHAGVTMISFDRPTDQPRPVEVIFPDYTIKVSRSYFYAVNCQLIR